MRAMRWGWAACVLLAVGCAGDAGTPGATPAADAARDTAPAVDEAVAALPDAALRKRAAEAIAARQLHAPAGRSAVELYLLLRDRQPDDAAVQQALVELQPYLVIAAENAHARGDADEAQRLVALLARVDAQAPALPRLRAETDALRTRLADAREREAARIARLANAAGPSTVSAPAPVPPTPPREPTPDASPATPPPATAARSAPAAASPLSDAQRAARDAELAAPTPSPTAMGAPSTPALPAAASTPPPARVPAAPPRLIADTPPRYPPQALRQRLEGQVTVAMTVGPDGRVDDVRVLSARPAQVFDDAALAAVRRWRFEATGRSASVQRTLNFTLPRERG